MKNKLFTTIILLCLGVTSLAQVGIGTDDPKALTHIRLQPSGNGVTPNTNADELLLENNSNAGLTIATEHLGSVYFGNSDDSDLGRLSYSTEDNYMRFSTDKQERMRIDSLGNVGIGIGFQYPIDSKLHIFDGGEDTRVVIQSKVEPRATASIALLGRDTQNVNSTHLFTTDIHDFVYKQGSNERMRIDANGDVGIGMDDPQYKLDVDGTIRGSNVSISSDKRWKKEIKTLDNSLDKITALRGVSYEWKRDEFTDKNFSEGTQIGVIAQEVETVFPELVHTDKEGYKSVSYSNLVAPLIEAIKEQQKQIENLQKEIEEIKKQ